MKNHCRLPRILILSLLSFSLFAPIVFFSLKLKALNSRGQYAFNEDLESVKYRKDDLTLNAIEQKKTEELKGPKLIVLNDKKFTSVVSHSSDENRGSNIQHASKLLATNDSVTNDKREDGHQIQQKRKPIRSGKDDLTLNAIEQKKTEELKGPKLIVLNDKKFNSVVSYSSDEIRGSNQSRDVQHASKLLATNDSETNDKREDGHQIQQKRKPIRSRKQEQFNQEASRQHQHSRSQSHRVTDKKLKRMNDQLITAKVYLSLASPDSHRRLVKELRMQIKEVEEAVGKANKDSDLSRSASHKMRSMEALLAKARHVIADCFEMGKTLHDMAYNAKKEIQAEKNRESFLFQLAGRTTPRGLHCLSMRLTAAYLLLQPEERQFPDRKKLYDLDLYHHAVFSDEVMACAVVVNSTTSSAKEPEKIVFHVVTDSLNLPAISMWFLLNPPGKATIHVQSIENFDWLSTEYFSTLKEQKSDDPYTSALNYLWFYLPDIFPSLDKIVLFDHDVVVQRDLTGLWSVNMKGKVHAAVETCQESEALFRSMQMFMNFSDPFLAKRFNASVCTWAFGMNLFDLQEWRRQNLTMLNRDYLQLGLKKPLWKVGSLPLGWITFYNQTVALEKRWLAIGLGNKPGISRAEIEHAAVIHYDGIMKPWLEIGIAEYKGYWSKHVQYDHPYLQQCNIHE